MFVVGLEDFGVSGRQGFVRRGWSRARLGFTRGRPTQCRYIVVCGGESETYRS
jgi:hypothetical protein